MFCARRIIHRRGYWQGHSRQLRGTSRGARSANPVTFCDDHRIDLVTVTAQILMPAHTLIGRRGALSPPPPWNESWNGSPGNTRVLGAARALLYGIGAGSGRMAPGHASCKRQVSGSNPLTGSKYQQVREAFSLVWRDREPELWNE